MTRLPKLFTLALAVFAVGSFFAVSDAAAVTVTYSSISGTGFQYTESGVRIRSYYNSFSNSGHYHSNSGDYIWYHSGCCSNRARIDLSAGGTFSLDSIVRRRSGTATWTAYNASGSSIGSVTVTGSSGTYNFPSNWSNLSRVDIVFSSGQSGWDSMVVNTCNPPSNANAGGPYTLAEGGSGNLSGSGSGDQTLSYNWDFTGNGVYNNASGASPTFNVGSSAGSALDGPGSHTVGLQVTSSTCSGTSTDTATINITNVAPTISTSSIPATGNEGSGVSFSVSASDVGPDTLTYLWSFGDGNSSTAQNPTHTYDDNSPYTVTVTVSDGDSGSVQASGGILISNVAPVIGTISGATNATEGDTESYSATVTDISSADANAGYTYAWVLTDTGGGTQTSSSATPSFTFADDDVYTLALTVTDKDGGIDTDSITINVVNANPTASISGPTSATEGQSLSFTGSATDPGSETFTYTWTFGDGGNATGTNVTHTYVDEGTGSYTVTLTVADGDGGSDQATQVVTVANVNPTIDTFVVPPSGVEAGVLAFTSSASDVGVNDVLTFLWDFGDGSQSTSQNPTHAYADEGTGSYTVTLTVSDGDTGTATQSTAITIANVNPVADPITGPATGIEGQALSYSSGGSDVGTLDTLTYSWDWGDGTTATPGASATHTYSNDGTYTITFTVTDNDGGTDTSTLTVVIANVPPTVTSISPALTGDEGTTYSFSASATDPSPVDSLGLTWSWNWDDNTSSGVGATPSHAWDDEGTYTVTATVTDPGGLTDSDTVAVTINNVAPEIVTNPPEFGDEAVEYTYAAGATDPGADTLTWSLASSAPAGAVIDPSTGVVTWTPTFAQQGINTFTVTVDDGDGGTDTQSWTVLVGFTDNDGDGMADTWETDNGLDPTTDDSGLDPDGDGLTNLDEFLTGQDPNVSDLPDPPVLTYPIQDEEVADPRPTLAWDPASDPNVDPLTYDVEVYEDAAMSTLVASIEGVDGLSWQQDSPLTLENHVYHWRARSDDGWGKSIFSDLETFFLNEFNEPPGEPVALYPVDEETIGTLTPSPEMVEGVDPDLDLVSHWVRVWNADGSEMLTEGYIAATARDVSWQIDITLEEDTWYQWNAQAEDEHGLTSDWTEPELFFATSENAPPLDVRFTSPDDGSAVESVSPSLTYTLSEDPEGRTVDYELDLDTDEGFNSGDLVSFLQEDGSAGLLDLAVEGTELTENTWWNARVRAVDQDSGTSAWDTIEFFVRGENDAPPTPVLVSPEDGAVIENPSPTLAVAHVEDPEGDLVLYEILVASDVEGALVIAQGDGLVGGAGPEGTADQTSWRVDANLEGVVYWTARAVDERGAASDWADPWMLTADTGEPVGAQPDDILTGGCSNCQGEASLASADAPVGFVALAMLLLVPAVRRRR